MTCNFTLTHYKEILLLAKKSAHEFSDFSTMPDLSKKRIYVRHDVEVSLDAALKIAKIEKKENVKSSYFIFMHSPSYNIFNDEDQKIIKEIAALGHDIGIHYEWGKGQSEENMIQEILKYYTILKALSFPMKEIVLVSFHKPPKKKGKALGKRFSQFISTYDPRFFRKKEDQETKDSPTKYISDSNNKWKESCACKFLENPSYQNLQVLTHPMWWNKKNLSKTDIYDKLVMEKVIHIKGWLKSNITAYGDLFKRPTA